jgi:hypothetical protein
MKRNCVSAHTLEALVCIAPCMLVQVAQNRAARTAKMERAAASIFTIIEKYRIHRGFMQQRQVVNCCWLLISASRG